MISRLGLILCLSCIFGCGSSGEFSVAKTSGKVVCNGQPVQNCMVFFEPLNEGENSLVGKQGFAVADSDGTFVLSTYGTGDGAVIGKHRVRVGVPHPEDFPKFQCDCVLDSEVDLMQVDIVGGKTNTFELVLKSKDASQPTAPPVVVDDGP